MSDSRPIRIVVVDDHDVVRHGLRVFIRTFADMEFVGEANNGLSAIRVCQETMPDLVLIDIFMPQMDGIEAIKHIKQDNPAIKILALTSSRAEETVVGALKAGAMGYILKNASFEEMDQAIRNVMAGRRTLSPEAATVLIQATTRQPAEQFDLTPRELEVLALLVTGLNNGEIAEQLFVSTSTVKYHISNLFTKIGAANRIDALKIAMEHHLIK
jgi:NarL family two-component system response regulator LiaR